MVARLRDGANAHGGYVDCSSHTIAAFCRRVGMQLAVRGLVTPADMEHEAQAILRAWERAEAVGPGVGEIAPAHEQGRVYVGRRLRWLTVGK
jgi:hypothetical protein